MLFVCLFFCLSVCLSVRPSVYLSVCLSVYLSITDIEENEVVLPLQCWMTLPHTSFPDNIRRFPMMNKCLQLKVRQNTLSDCRSGEKQ